MSTGKKLPHDVNIKGVFACNELDLREVRVYGFDYDYTLACYKPSMDFLLYNLGRDRLVDKLKVCISLPKNISFSQFTNLLVKALKLNYLFFQYPEGIRELEYQPGFAIRGLHYDVSKGLLLKLDSFLQIQLGSVYRGLTPLSDEEVMKLYKSRTIPLAYVESGRGGAVSK